MTFLMHVGNGLYELREIRVNLNLAYDARNLSTYRDATLVVSELGTGLVYSGYAY